MERVRSRRVYTCVFNVFKFYYYYLGSSESARFQTGCLKYDGMLHYLMVFTVNPFTAPACKISRLKIAHALMQTVYFPVL